jgi:hypothetical protein
VTATASATSKRVSSTFPDEPTDPVEAAARAVELASSPVFEDGVVHAPIHVRGVVLPDDGSTSWQCPSCCCGQPVDTRRGA